MNWNQISENILCNSEYYVEMYDSDPNRFFHKLSNVNTNYISDFITNKHASFFEEYLQINLPNSKTPLKTSGVEINRRDLKLYSNEKITKSSSFLNIEYRYTFDFVYKGIYKGKLGQCFTQNNQKNHIYTITPDNTTNTTLLTLRTLPINLFHFSFHGKDPNLKRTEKRLGAFHLRIDKMLTTKGFRKIQKNFRPFILLDTGKFALFDDFSYLRPRRLKNTHKKVHNYITTMDERVKTNELQTYFTRKKTNRNLITTVHDDNGIRMNYVHQIIKPIYDNIINQALNPLVPLVFPNGVNPPKLHRYHPDLVVSKADANNPAKVRYCISNEYTDGDIQHAHKFTTDVLHGGKSRKKYR